MKQGAFVQFYQPGEIVELKRAVSTPPLAGDRDGDRSGPDCDDIGHLSFRDRVRAHFDAHPNEWVSADDLARIGGKMAWRTRVSDVRRFFGLTIENRTRRVPSADGEGFFVVSEYRYTP